MKKKILLIVFASFMITGVVSAASLWGSYKGNQIIRLTADGVPVKVSDAPAISMDGRTMIPIYLLKQARINYTWDQKSQTVDIKKSGTQGTSELTKMYAKISNHYYRLGVLGDIAWDTGNRFSNALRSLDTGRDKFSTVEAVKNHIDNLMNRYNSIVSENKSLSIEANNTGIAILDASATLKYYSDALDYYEEAFSGLMSYATNPSEQLLDKIYDNLELGDDESNVGITKSHDGYQNFINKIINSK